jgi:hypothetical protein
MLHAVLHHSSLGMVFVHWDRPTMQHRGRSYTNLQPALRSPRGLNGGARLGGVRQPRSDADGKGAALQHLRQQGSEHL